MKKFPAFIILFLGCVQIGMTQDITSETIWDALPPDVAAVGNIGQWSELGDEAAGEPAAEAQAAGIEKQAISTVVKPTIDSKNIVLGYIQNTTNADSYPWHTLTHVAYLFTDFNSSGTIINQNSWINRNSHFQPGGTADRYGVKVLMCLRPVDFDGDTIRSVMNSATLRTTLVNNVMALIAAGGDNCAGVTMDLEPYSAVRDSSAGITLFMAEMKAALGTKELSFYAWPTFSSSFDISGWVASCDYFIYSTYTFYGSDASIAGAIAPLHLYSVQVDKYLLNGCPAEKMVLALPSYGFKHYTTAAGYGVPSSGGGGSIGYTIAKFDTFRDPSYPRGYDEPSVSAWYSILQNDGTYITSNYDDEHSMAVKVGGARSWSGTQYSGRKLRGVGFWSLRWMTDNPSNNFKSYDMETAAMVSRYRTYPLIYQDCEELLAPPGTRTFPIEKWEHLEARWRDPSATGCTVDNVGLNSSAISCVSVPNVAGKPDNSAYCLRLYYNFAAKTGNRLFLRHEILADETYKTIPDLNAAKALFSINTTVSVDVYTAVALTGRSLQFVLMDAKGELEVGPEIALDGTGWRTVSIDLTTDMVSGFTTNFKSFKSGDGVLDTAGDDAYDIACVGFILNGGGVSGTGYVYLDELRYTKTVPPDNQYVINEFSYASPTSQFVEIYGPAGTFPSGMTLRTITGSTGEVATTVSLGGRAVPNNGNGYGYYVVGTSGVANVDQVIASSVVPTATPSALQLYDTATGAVCDAVVYNAHGGLGGLDGIGDPRVTRNGPPWFGGAGSGTSSSGLAYSIGRPNDGANTWVNYDDFCVMPRTPGATNRVMLNYPLSWDFSTVPTNALQTFQALAVTTSAVGPSPSGGKVYRCCDTSGGGIQAFFGSPELGADGNGYTVTGEVYIPSPSQPPQATGLGICGRHGSTFFSSVTASGAYEDGYWLIYENAPGVGLNDGRPDHAGTFEFVWAHNNNSYPTAVELLASKTLADLGVTAGTWTTFEMSVVPAAAANEQLLIKLGGATVYSGALPEGGPTKGAFQVGFRENHSGAPSSVEGTWIDNLKINDAPSRVDRWELF